MLKIPIGGWTVGEDEEKLSYHYILTESYGFVGGNGKQHLVSSYEE